LFGFFTNKQGKMLLAETRRAILNADENIDKKEKKIIANNVLNKVFSYISEMEGLKKPSKELDALIRYQCLEVTKRRQDAISPLGEKNPEWVEAAIIESFIQANSNTFGKKISREVTSIIFDWCRYNITNNHLKIFEEKYGTLDVIR
jgi:hypothetical protein